MAVVNQLNLNVGTEQNPNFVLHDINDKRISKTTVTTATHILTCNSGVTSIAPITAANLASVLGEFFFGSSAINITSNSELKTYTSPGVYRIPSESVAQTISDNPYKTGGSMVFVISAYNNGNYVVQISISTAGLYARRKTTTSTFASWKSILDF